MPHLPEAIILVLVPIPLWCQQPLLEPFYEPIGIGS
jgi:hypothetical protein